MQIFLNLIEAVTGWIKKAMEWIDRLFNNFEWYSTKYGEFLVYGLLIFLLGKMLKIKLEVKK